MDIPGLFRKQTKRNEEKCKAPLIIGDDDDDFKDSATSKPSHKAVKRKRTRRRITDESDSEDEGSVKKRKSMQTIPTSTKTLKKSEQKLKGKNTPVKGKDKNSSTPGKKIQTVTDFFGSTPIKRSKPAKLEAQDGGSTTATNNMRNGAEEEEIDTIPESPVDVLMQGIDDAAIAQALQEEEMEIMRQKEKQVHRDKEFTKTLTELDEKEAAVSKTTPTKPPAKKLKLMMEKLPVSWSPSKTPTKSNGPQREASQKPLSSNTSRAKRGILYIDDDDWEEEKKERKAPAQPAVKVVTPNKTSSKGGASSSKPAKQAATPPPISAHLHTPKQVETGLTTPKQATPVSKGSSTSTPPIKPTRAESYARYLHRGGPKAPRSKPIPEGAENCLQGLTFVITGVLESLEREEASELIKKYGGKVTGSISGRTSYVVVGEEAGESKLNKARQHNTPQINEDELLDLIRNKPSAKQGGTRPAKKAAKKTAASKKKSPSPSKPLVSSGAAVKPTPAIPNSTSHVTTLSSGSTPTQKSHMTTTTPVAVGTSKMSPATPTQGGDSLLWVDKYKPKSIKNIIGQHGERSNAKKLLKWLQSWEKNRESNEGGGAKRLGGGEAQDDRASFKAALLSGPPGVGKTTTATLVCEEAGYSFIEMNASANRSKKTLQNEVASHLSCLSIDTFMGGAKHGVTSGRRHALIMDEVDGMAGNEDRGGMQELIGMIKTTKVPIICICNDRQSTKIRSLANHCFDLRFQKPRVEQIKGAMMSVCFKEGLKIEPQAITEMVLASGQDVRQVLHNLLMWSASEKSFTVDVAKESAKGIQKHSKMNPFDVVRSVFISKELTLNERSDLFFYDYNIASLFVQENYISARPQKARGNSCEVMKCIAKAADSICDGELVEKQIRASSRWELLPLQAYLSSVIPGNFMQGFFGKPMFPQWLGNNSKRGKCDRMLQELQRHTRLATSCSKIEFGMDYLPFISSKLAQPLLSQGTDGVSDVVSSMEHYDLVREDWDSIMELAYFTGRPDIAQQIPSKVKAAFTRAYNKGSHSTHYATVSMKKIQQRRSTTDSLEGEYGEGGDGGSNMNGSEPDSADEDLSSNPMIKLKSKKEAETRGKGGSQGSKKGKGRAGGQEGERKKGKKK